MSNREYHMRNEESTVMYLPCRSAFSLSLLLQVSALVQVNVRDQWHKRAAMGNGLVVRTRYLFHTHCGSTLNLSPLYLQTQAWALHYITATVILHTLLTSIQSSVVCCHQSCMQEILIACRRLWCFVCAVKISCSGLLCAEHCFHSVLFSGSSYVRQESVSEYWFLLLHVWIEYYFEPFSS